MIKKIEKNYKMFYWLLMISIFLSYWLLSRQYYGPAYLMDEVGYLTKAATIAGYKVDLVNHWNAGYSMMIAPFFKIFNDPYTIWQAIIVFNAIVWVFSYMILFSVLQILFPDNKNSYILFAVVISAMYPSWISMSGYAFATTAYVFVYMLSIYVLLRVSSTNMRLLPMFLVLVVLLYWIHPAGKINIVAAITAVIVYLGYHKKYKTIFLTIIMMSLLISVYKFGLHYWLDLKMTGKIYKAHASYKTVSEAIDAFGYSRFWIGWLTMFLGNLTSIFISTFGLAAYAVFYMLKQIKKSIETNSNNPNDISIIKITALIYILISFGGMALGGSFSSAMGFAKHAVWQSMWNYERYIDMVLLPLIGIGVLSSWRFGVALFSSILVAMTGYILYVYTYDMRDLGIFKFYNRIDIQSFWPEVLLQNKDFFWAYSVGAIAILAVYFLRKKNFIYLLLPLWILSMYSQYDWHDNRWLKSYSKPSGFYELISNNYAKEKCIGYDPYIPRSSHYLSERYRMYSYYFYNYDLVRMPPEKWLCLCSGPYMTYRPEYFSNRKDITIVAKEDRSNLYIVMKKDGAFSVSGNKTDYKNMMFIMKDAEKVLETKKKNQK